MNAKQNHTHHTESKSALKTFVELRDQIEENRQQTCKL